MGHLARIEPHQAHHPDRLFAAKGGKEGKIGEKLADRLVGQLLQILRGAGEGGGGLQQGLAPERAKGLGILGGEAADRRWGNVFCGHAFLSHGLRRPARTSPMIRPDAPIQHLEWTSGAGCRKAFVT